MDKKKREKLEAAGWRFGDAADFLGLNEEERRLVDLQFLHDRFIGDDPAKLKALNFHKKAVIVSVALYDMRMAAEMSQEEFAEFVGTEPNVIQRFEDSDFDWIPRS